ncbi:hypothetical protein D0T87_05310 [Bacteroides sp. 51]|nr:hypothetical protein [Bacteroides sp. 51]
MLEIAKYRQNDILIIEWSSNRKFRAWGRKEKKNGKRIMFAKINKIENHKTNYPNAPNTIE